MILRLLVWWACLGPWARLGLAFAAYFCAALGAGFLLYMLGERL